MRSFIISVAAAGGLMVAGNAMSMDMPPLAHKNGCISCHAIDHKVVGPAWQDVAKKYKGVKNYTYNGKEYPLVEGLMHKVSHGGSGNWGSVPMIANDPKEKKQDEIKQLVEFELSLAK
jgi:cytochrome c